jgi:hypothetical protein
MDTAETRRKAPQPAPARVECCADSACASGLKNHYYEGKRLTPDSFRVEQRYLVERRRLLNRTIHGWGVVSGYAVISAAGRLRIGAGLALDKCGRELVQTERVERGFDHVIVLDQNHRPAPPPAVPTRYGSQAPPRVCWLLSVHYAEQAVGPVTITDPCHCERHEWDRVCETVRYSLKQIDCEARCHEEPCGLECRCATGPCCEAHDTTAASGERPPCPPFTRGGCQCLCEHVTGLPTDVEGCRLYEIDEPCGRVRVDLKHGVPLACVELVEDDCHRWAFDTEIEACGPRRIVKGNDLLFDLIRGCDLTRISAIGWAKLHRPDFPVLWSDFLTSFGQPDPANSGCYITESYWVEFSRAVRAETVRADCFAMTILVAEDEAGWWIPRRVPILDVIKTGPNPDLVTRATLVVDAGWVEAAMTARKTIFNQDEALVEIEVLGDYIVDCNGQTVDANVRGLCAVPSGNGTPGGTLRSSFRVAARGPQGPPYDTSPRVQGA